MRISRPYNMLQLGFSAFIGLTNLYLGPLIKRFPKKLFSMVRRSPASICVWCLSAKGELLHLHVRLSDKLIEIETLSRYRWIQFLSNHCHRKFNR